MKNIVDKFLANVKIERTFDNEGSDYTYSYDGKVIAIYVPDDELTEDTLRLLNEAVSHAVEKLYSQ